MHDTTVLYDGATACLEYILRAGLRWGIVTNKGHRYARPVLEHLRLRPEVLVCGDMVLQAKPAPDGLLAAARALGCAPADCVVVGDDGKDILAAAAAGMPSIAALYGLSSQLGDPDLKGAWAAIETLHALPAALQRIGFVGAGDAGSVVARS
jgi:phosphoglycolate phosphatase